jgi:hypothetical protein
VEVAQPPKVPAALPAAALQQPEVRPEAPLESGWEPRGTRAFLPLEQPLQAAQLAQALELSLPESTAAREVGLVLPPEPGAQPPALPQLEPLRAEAEARRLPSAG